MELAQLQNFIPIFLLAVKVHPWLSMYYHFMFSHSDNVKRVKIYLLKASKNSKTKYEISLEF